MEEQREAEGGADSRDSRRGIRCITEELLLKFTHSHSQSLNLSTGDKRIKLYDVSRLRPLSSLSQLAVSGRPASSPPHSRLFLLFRLRTLDGLDDLPATQEDGGHAHQERTTAAESTRAFLRLCEPDPPPPRGVQKLNNTAESSFISEVQHIHNPITSTSRASSPSPPQTQAGSDVHPDVDTPPPMLHACRTQQSAAEADFLQLMETELRVLEEAGTHTQAHATAPPGVMSGRQSELEGRLDDFLSRIATETQEIRELEQQLTDGQIQANEVLQRDLEGVIAGLQEYLQGLREQTRGSEQQVLALKAENQSLQLHLDDAQRRCRQLEDAARAHTQDASALRTEARALRDRQVEQEAELRQLREELTLQDENSHTLQTQLDQTRTQLDQITAGLLDQSGLAGLGDDSPAGPEVLMSSSVERLSRALQQTRTSRDREQIARLQTQLTWDQDRIAQLEARVAQDHRDQESEQSLREDLQRLRDVQQNLESQLDRTRQQRDTLLRQLRSQSERHRRRLGRLNRKLRRLDRTDADRRTAESLESATNQLRALNRAMPPLHMHLTPGPAEHAHEDAHTAEQLRAELAEAQRHARALRRQLDRVRTGTGAADRGPAAPSLGSLGTQDSGVGLQYLSPPDRGRRQDGSWSCSPPGRPEPDAGWRDSGGGSDRSSAGGATPPPAPPPDPAAGPAWLLCAPPGLLVPGHTALHCNVPEHREPCVCVHEEAERLEEEKKKLRLETRQLRHTLRRHRSVLQVCEEVQCVEETLVRRRAELRQADRLLLEAQSCAHTSRERASSAQLEVDMLQCRAQDSATCLLEATWHARELEEEVVDLRRKRQEEEQSLREVKEENQQLSTQISSATHRLSAVLSDLQEAQRSLDSVTSQVEQQEQRLVQRREEHHTAVNRVKEVREEEQHLQSSVQELLQQQEVLLSERRSTASALTEEQHKLVTLQRELNTHRAELRRVLQELLVEQQALEEVKTKRTQTLQRLRRKKKEEVERRQEEVDVKTDEVDGKRAELTVLQQEVESHRKEAELSLRDAKQQRAELQELQEELTRRKTERSSLQEQCKHLEARRRHADRCLSAVQDDLTKQREELHRTQLLRQEVVRGSGRTLCEGRNTK